MKPKSIAALYFYVGNLEKTKKFYETLGFRFGEPKGDYLTAYINWFSVEFHPKPDAVNAGSGQYVYINVESVNDFYKAAVAAGLKPEGEPADSANPKRREFTVKDPDGYQLTFFEKK